MKLQDYPVIVVVFGQMGCPACSSYIPRFRAVASKYARCIPSAVFDASQPAVSPVADHYRITATPTTLVLRYGQRASRPIEGEATNADIEAIFQRAVRGTECTL